MYLALPIRADDGSDLCSLDDCLRNYFKAETLGTEIGLRCDECKQNTTFGKSIVVTKPPHILIVHLKRFGFESGTTVKLNHMVEYPLRKLDVSEYVAGDASVVYDLFAVTCHRGKINFGHYYAVSYDVVESHWVLFDDNLNAPVAEDRINVVVQSYEAYMLFYIKRDLQVFRRQTLSNFD